MSQMLTHPDLFTPVELTEAVNKLPLVPLRMHRLFTQKSIRTTNVAMDIRKGRLVLVSNQDRRDPPQEMHGQGGKTGTKILEAAHLPLADTVSPDDIQNVRGFGTTEPVSAASVINDKMADLKNSVAMTTEFHRLGAVKGVIYDADGTTVLHNLFEVFGVTQKTLNLVFPTNSTAFNPITKVILDAKRWVEDKLGGNPAQRFEAIVGSDFYDMLTSHKLVREAFNLWNANQSNFDNNDFRKRGFTYGGVTFIEASEVVGGRQLVEPTKAHFYPVGLDIFMQYNAPANWIETVNTMGNEFYARMDEKKKGRGYDLEVQSNPLAVCAYPEALVELTASAGNVNE
jgi:hypothetical protein